jgi:hypothetical protein
LREESDTPVFYQKLVLLVVLPFFLVTVPLSFWIPLALKRKSMAVIKNQYITSVIILLFLAHSPIVDAVFSPFS